MKKSDILIILFGSLIVIACFIGYLYFHLNETVFYIIFDGRVINESISDINESVNPFKGMKKVKMSDAEWGKARKTGNYVTDGFDNVYEVPKTGYSDIIKHKGMYFRYNFKDRQIEVLEDDKKTVVSWMGLTPSNWVDGPEYWIEQFIKEGI